MRNRNKVRVSGGEGGWPGGYGHSFVYLFLTELQTVLGSELGGKASSLHTVKADEKPS